MLFNTLKFTKSSIVFLSLQGNRLDDESMQSLGEYIMSNSLISGIDISNNLITDVGVETLSRFLNGNTTLKTIYFQGIKEITDKSNQILIKMIESSSIERIEINETSITQNNLLVAPLAQNILKNQPAKLEMGFR